MTSTGRIFSKLSELRLRVIGIDARMPTTAQLTSELGDVYYVGVGADIRGDPGKIAALVSQRRAELWPDGSYRTAFLLAPKSRLRTRQSDPASIDLELWQKISSTPR